MVYMNDVSTEDLQAFKAAFFRALAHPVRIRILELLVRGERSVQELQEALGVDQPVVSQQLAVLRATNIVSGKKEGQRRYDSRHVISLDCSSSNLRNHLVGTGSSAVASIVAVTARPLRALRHGGGKGL